ncbi:MAG: methyl-accepting chemotaxis protein, partial [Mangrovibacterium sp.]
MRMRFVDLPLKMKLFWAFAAFIMIALALSIMSIYTLWHFDRGLHSLTTDMRPELTFVSDLSKQTQQLANSVHSYVLLGKSDHYQEAEKRIESLRELISGKERMVDNRPEMKRFEELAVKYEELIREAYRLDRDISRVRTTIGQYETRYTEDCRRILNDQESLLQKDVARGAGTGLRTKNLKIVGSLLDTGNRISLQERTANFSNGEIFAGEVDSLFYTIDGDLESLRLSIRGSQSVALVEALYNTVSVFRDALTDFSGLLQKQASLLNEHREIFDRLTVSAENLYADVIQNAVATSESFSGKIAGSIARNSVMVLLTAAIALFLAVFISRQITRPLSKGVAFAQSISRGDLTVKLAVERKDEIGDLALNLQQMSEVMRQTIASVTSAADNMANASMELSATSQNVSQGSSEQASSAEEMSSAMEQMSANIRQNMEHAKATEKISS